MLSKKLPAGNNSIIAIAKVNIKPALTPGTKIPVIPIIIMNIIAYINPNTAEIDDIIRV